MVPVMGPITSRTAGRRRVGVRAAAVAVLMLSLSCWLLGAPRVALAHATLTDSDPAANALVATEPAQVTMHFAERVEPSASRAALYDRAGKTIVGTSFTIPDPKTIVLTMPPGLPNGTYAIVWTTLSADDGHTASGYLSFTIGTNSDVASVTLPALGTSNAPSIWWTTLARGVAYAGLALLVGIWPIWLLVVRPALGRWWRDGRAAVRRARGLVWLGLALALAGSGLALTLQAVAAGGAFAPALRDTLTDTRFGHLWLVRVVLLVTVAGLLLTLAPWWAPRRRSRIAGALAVIPAVAALPFSLLSHAEAQPFGAVAAVANDMAHAIAASLWFGGIVVLVGVLLPALRGAGARRLVLARAIPRFSTIALWAWLMLALTGFYQALLQVGNLTALRYTAYGHSLIVKGLVALAIIAFAGLNLLVVGRRLRRAATDDAPSRWVGIFRVTVVAELLLGVAVMGVTGRLTAQQPGREDLAQRSGQIVRALHLGDRNGSLGLAPGASGVNHFQMQLGGEPLPQDSRVILRVALPATTSEPQDIVMDRVAGDSWEWHGSELAAPGDWRFDVIVRQAGAEDEIEHLTIPIGTEPPRLNVPGTPPRFESVGVTALALIVAGLGGLILAVRVLDAYTRREVAGLSAVGIVLGAFLLLQGQVNPELDAIPSVNPQTADAASITAGSTLWTTNCLACHGPDGKGHGLRAASLAYPPPDLTTGHELYHSDRDVYYAISHGVDGSDMPGFGDRLAATDIWNLINYIHHLQGIASGDAGQGAVQKVVATPAGLGVAAVAADTGALGETCRALITPVCFERAPQLLMVSTPSPGGPGKALYVADVGRQLAVSRPLAPTVIAGLPAGSFSGATPGAGIPPGSGMHP